jgi:CheY-like chemotaxis protein
MSELAPILVVDDDVELRRAICEVLEHAGYLTMTADHGRAALDILVTGGVTPALILLDIRMPVMDGWEFVRIVRCYTRLAHIPIVVASTPVVGYRWHPEVNGVLSKPFTTDALLAEIRRHLATEAVG